MDAVTRIVGARIGFGPGDPTTIDLDGDRITSIRPADSRRRVDEDPDGSVLDAHGLHVVPGFVDLQCNGAIGIDITREPARLWDVAEVLPRWGVTSWLPTVVTAPRAARDAALAALAAGPPDGLGPHAEPLGLHLEGPFLAPSRAGAHRRELLAAPDAEEAAGWSRAAGVALVTMAPELPGALEVAVGLVERGVVVSAGHSDATVEQARAAADAGFSMVTHLFNAMAPMHHRAPGLAGLALADARLAAGLIADGVHVHPTVVAAAAAALGDRLVLVTDAVAALGLPPGRVGVGGLEAASDGGGVRLPDGTLAGSDLAMDQAVRNLLAFTGCAADTAVSSATAAPARVLGLTGRGHLDVGGRADLVLLTDGFDVAATICAGRLWGTAQIG